MIFCQRFASFRIWSKYQCIQKHHLNTAHELFPQPSSSSLFATQFCWNDPDDHFPMTMTPLCLTNETFHGRISMKFPIVAEVQHSIAQFICCWTNDKLKWSAKKLQLDTETSRLLILVRFASFSQSKEHILLSKKRLLIAHKSKSGILLICIISF